MANTFEEFLTPVKELNELTLKNIEEISAIQVKAIEENAKASMDALKASVEIKDFDTFNSYLKEQASTAQNIANNAIEDSKEIAKLTEAYTNNVKALIEKSIPAV
ncbi:MAG: phasin family protein [Gammaproteobacteria bacterium]|jgi:phasin family protein